MSDHTYILCKFEVNYLKLSEIFLTLTIIQLVYFPTVVTLADLDTGYLLHCRNIWIRSYSSSRLQINDLWN